MRVLTFLRIPQFQFRMANNDALKLKSLASEIESLIAVVQKEISDFVSTTATQLENENSSLEKEILKSKEELTNLQKKNGISHVDIPSGNVSKTPKTDKKQEQKPKVAKNVTPTSKPQTQEKVVHFGRLDLRMGRILEVKDHPQADNLYIETIDVGEEQPRIIISGIRKHITREDFLKTPVVVVCNLKPANLRGVKSYGMLLCAVNDKTVEPVRTSSDAVPGQRLRVEGIDSTPDKELNPKEKVFETVVKDLRINADKILVYKNTVVTCGDKGLVTTKNISDCSVA